MLNLYKAIRLLGIPAQQSLAGFGNLRLPKHFYCGKLKFTAACGLCCCKTEHLLLSPQCPAVFLVAAITK